MIDYNTGYWSIGLIFRLDGSVFPRAFMWAFPSATISVLIDFAYFSAYKGEPYTNVSQLTSIWSSFTFVLGFLVVFRTQQAYSRYWEGAMLLRRARGEWMTSYSSCISFCSLKPEMRMEVEVWQHLLTRLFSMLNCVALQTVADMDDDHFEYFDTTGMEPQHLNYLAGKYDRCTRMEILVQWIQRHVKVANEKGIIDVPPPVLSRAYQELSQGAVSFNQLRNFTEIPFPFPYSQLISVMLVLYTIFISTFAGLFLRNPTWGAILTFVSVFAFWGTHYIAAEIESPFGDDVNDLPLKRMQEDMNPSLWVLLERHAHTTPDYLFEKETARLPYVRSDTFSNVMGKRVDKGKTLDVLVGTHSLDSVDDKEKKKKKRNSKKRCKNFATTPPALMTQLQSRHPDGSFPVEKFDLERNSLQTNISRESRVKFDLQCEQFGVQQSLDSDLCDARVTERTSDAEVQDMAQIPIAHEVHAFPKEVTSRSSASWQDITSEARLARRAV